MYESDNFPNHSYKLKVNGFFLVAQYFGAVVILIAISTATSVIIVNLHFRGERSHKVPRWMKKLVLDWTARIVCIKGTVDRLYSGEDSVPVGCDPSSSGI